MVDTTSCCVSAQPGETHPTEDFDHVRLMRECFEVEQRAFVDSTRKLDLSRYGAGKSRRTHMDVHPQTRIPDVLLCGPFDREMCDRLFWLMKGGARLTAADSWEVSRTPTISLSRKALAKAQRPR